jgi:hypothetical protein
VGAGDARVDEDLSDILSEQELLQLEERAVQSQNALAAACGPDSQSLHVTIFSLAVESQHPDGSWGSDDYPRMKPCFTAQTIEMISQLENRQRIEETLIRPAMVAVERSRTLLSTERVQLAVAWLRLVQREDGGWGEDAWDTCQVLKALALAGLPPGDGSVAAGLSLLRDSVDNDWPDRSSYWFGPGFMGSSLEVFNRFGDSRYAGIALDQLWRYFHEDTGSFHLAIDPANVRHAPPEWHTACAITGLRSFGSVAPSREKSIRAAAWLAHQQADDGCWSSGHANITEYCTSQAVIALASLVNTASDHAPHGPEHAARGTEWFVRNCNLPGTALTTKLMAAGAIARTHAGDLVIELPLSFANEVRDLIRQYSIELSSASTEAQIARAEAKSREDQMMVVSAGSENISERLQQAERHVGELQEKSSESRRVEDELRERLASYALKLTANQIAVFGILITFFSALIGVLVSYFVGR